MSLRRESTSLPRSKTIGLKPNSIRRNAANNPAGPAPTTTTCFAFATDLYSIGVIKDRDSGTSSIYTLTVKFIITFL